MDSILPTSFDIFEIYRQYCDITSGMPSAVGDCCMPDEEPQKMRFIREALSQLLEVVESKSNTRVTIIEEAYKLMLGIGLMADLSDFSRFYDFVFFICRENGQKNITVSRAVMAWRLVLAGRFRLLDQWCNFIEENQRHNISEDTWRQVLAFSRCVHENLEGYDPEGAWPVLIDDFVEHMYRIRGSVEIPKVSWDCGGLEPQPSEDSLTGLKNLPGSKRKSCDNLQMEMDISEGHASHICTTNSKRRHIYFDKSVMLGQNQLLKAAYTFNEMDKHKKNSVGCTKSLNAVEGSLSKGFARLLSGHSAR
ncbi:defective in cullin neddylation protein AAR3 isoform X2 [Henckelia pumila]|uniref:defective in cullin neddylation protein AAR3 isoform X2 n=1 Tax=Henckelia pumila TaxID=405737 RepID=UPI003C6E7135